jgi:ATP-dependent Clp protease ATP-binding subunit ClpB
VVLFDEIEKAHPEVFNILLQILDDGRLTDSQGRTVDFSHAVIIMTSNLGSPLILERSASAEWAEVETLVMAELKRYFRPEFLNRVDDVVVYRPLGLEELDRIVDLQLGRVARLLAERQIRLRVSPPARELIAQEGYDPAYGARPLKRSIQRLLQNPLALRLLEGEFEDGDLIEVDREGGSMQLTFAHGVAAPVGADAPIA